MNVAALSGQYSLMEPTVAHPQYRSVIVGELGGDTQTWRHHVPGVQCAKTVNNLSCFTPLKVDRLEVRTDGAAVVEPDAGIDGQPLSYRYRVGHEEGCADELAAINRRGPGDGSIGKPVVVDVSDARRNDDRLTVLALFDFCTDFPRMTGPETVRAGSG